MGCCLLVNVRLTIKHLADSRSGVHASSGGRTNLCLVGKRGAEEEHRGPDDDHALHDIADTMRDRADAGQGVEGKLHAAAQLSTPKCRGVTHHAYNCDAMTGGIQHMISPVLTIMLCAKGVSHISQGSSDALNTHVQAICEFHVLVQRILGAGAGHRGR